MFVFVASKQKQKKNKITTKTVHGHNATRLHHKSCFILRISDKKKTTNNTKKKIII